MPTIIDHPKKVELTLPSRILRLANRKSSNASVFNLMETFS